MRHFKASGPVAGQPADRLGGARGRASQARTREAPASRPPALGPAAFNGWTWRERRRAEAHRIEGAESLSGSAPGSTAPGTEKPRWSAAGRSVLRQGRPRRKAWNRWWRHAALHPPRTLCGGRLPRPPCCGGTRACPPKPEGRRRETTGLPGAAQRTRAMAHARRLFDNRIGGTKKPAARMAGSRAAGNSTSRAQTPLRSERPLLRQAAM